MRSALVLATTLLAGTAVLVPAAPALAESRVEVSNDRGTNGADLTYRTALTVRGTGFQSVRGGFGGVYVMFGWVRDPGGQAWRPSRGGLTGQDYRYIPDSESSADNQGYLRFVAFPGGATAGEAADVLSGAGDFSVGLTVPGPVFESVDRDGQVVEVDCRRVTCGVITIGAHGVKSAANETFTPVRFGDVYDTAPAGPSAEATTPPASPAAPTTSPGPGATGTTGTTGGQQPTTRTGRPAATAPALTVDRTTAVAGHALTFTARGFTPGEQVLAVLDDGAAAVGPMLAGASGEVAGVLQLPVDVSAGTHELRLTGAASGAAPSQRFPVQTGAPQAVSTAEEPAEPDQAAATWVLAGAAGLFLLSLAAYVVTRLRRRPRLVGSTA